MNLPWEQVIIADETNKKEQMKIGNMLKVIFYRESWTVMLVLILNEKLLRANWKFEVNIIVFVSVLTKQRSSFDDSCCMR